MASYVRFFMVLVLLAPQASAVCSHYLDCPEPECPGSLRLCISGTCINTRCSFEVADTESYSEAFKPYEEALNVSMMEEEGEFRTGLLGAFGITDVFRSLGMGFAVIAVVLLVLLLLYFFKSKSKLAFALGMAVTLLMLGLLFGSFLTGENLFRRAILFGPGDWDSQSFADFVPEKIAESTGRTPVRSSVSRAELASVSPLLKKGIAYRFESQTESAISLMMLELYRAVDVSGIPGFFVGEVSESKMIAGEKVFFGESDNRLRRAVWDDDRYIFIVESSSDDMDDVISAIIGRYPKRPEESKIAVQDSYPPVIRFIEPLPDSIGSSLDVVVEIDDSLSGIVLRSISSDHDPFRAVRDCEHLENGTVLCIWTPDYSEGLNSLAVTAVDRSGNTAVESIAFTIDTERPIVEVWPREGFVADRNELVIELSDAVAGIDPDSVSIWLNGEALETDCLPATDAWICRYENVLSEGSNVLRFEAQDKIGNLIILKREVIHDSYPPDISFLLSDPNKVTFTVSDRGVGVSMNSIAMNAEGFEPSKDCFVDGNLIRCEYSGPWGSGLFVTATDRAGLVRSVEYPYLPGVGKI